MIRTKSEGSIILIASMSASVANRGLDCVAYNASKAGVLQMGRNLACEWGKYKIRVNACSVPPLNANNRQSRRGILRHLW